MQHIKLGNACIEPERSVEAGSFTTCIYTYMAGHPIDDSGFVKIVFRQVGDFGTPQFEDPVAPNYCSIRTTGDCRIEPRWDANGHPRPWGRTLFLKIRAGFLNEGEKVIVTFGDTSRGSPGWQMQTFCEDTFEFKTLVDPIATHVFKELPHSPTLHIVAGDPVRAICIAPSQIQVNKRFHYHLKLEDRWGNPTHLPQKISHNGFGQSGVQAVTATDESTGLSASSNPIDVLHEKVSLHPFWADFHGQTEETIGSNAIEDYFTFARDYGLLNISAHQGNDFQVTDEFWDKINQMTRQFYDPDSFVTFPGYEWSGNTPLGGDRNVYYSSEGGQIMRSSRDLLPGNHSIFADAPTAAKLFKMLKKQREPKAFAFAHVGGRYADLSMHDPEIELAVEVHSAWGTFQWLVDDALQRGYRIGICANSDGHKCRPGASYPGAGTFGSLGGLTCVWAKRLDRKHIFEALKSRHFYATTGNRSLVDIELKTGDGQTAIMGDVIHVDATAPQLHVRIIGTVPVERVDVHNGLETLETIRPYGEGDLGSRIKVIWQGAEKRGRYRMVSWDGGLSIQNNTILDATPINFWNSNHPIERIGTDQIAWKSITTGGVSGLILKLDKLQAGSIEINTRQRRVTFPIRSVGLEPKTWECGGLRKMIEIYRLPDQSPPCEYSFSLPLTSLHMGDNPIYIRMVQEDGHMAWTSPLYIVRQDRAGING